MAHVTRRSGVEAPAARVSSKRTSSSAVPLGAGSISESVNSSRRTSGSADETTWWTAPTAGAATTRSATRRLLHGGSAAAAAGAALPPILSSLDSLLVTHEYRALMLSRFAMLPFSVKNYGLGALPSVRLYPFAVTCFFGDLPFTVAFAYAGHSVKSLVDVAEGRETAMGGRSSMAIMLISVLGTVGLPLLLTRPQKKKQENKQRRKGQTLFILIFGCQKRMA